MAVIVCYLTVSASLAHSAKLQSGTEADRTRYNVMAVIVRLLTVSARMARSAILRSITKSERGMTLWL